MKRHLPRSMLIRIIQPRKCKQYSCSKLRRFLNIFLINDKKSISVEILYHGCWWHGVDQSQSISRSLFGLVLLGFSRPGTGKFIELFTVCYVWIWHDMTRHDTTRHHGSIASNQAPAVVFTPKYDTLILIHYFDSYGTLSWAIVSNYLISHVPMCVKSRMLTKKLDAQTGKK